MPRRDVRGLLRALLRQTEKDSTPLDLFHHSAAADRWGIPGTAGNSRIPEDVRTELRRIDTRQSRGRLFSTNYLFIKQMRGIFSSELRQF